MNKITLVVVGLALAGLVQAECYELRAANGSVLSESSAPRFAWGTTSTAKTASMARGEYITARQGECAVHQPMRQDPAPAPKVREFSHANLKHDVVSGPACRAPDGRWYPYDSPACDPIATSAWLQKDLDFLDLYQSFLDGCALGMDINGREGATSDECVTVEEARPRMQATLNKVLALPEGTLTSAQLRVLHRLSEGHQDVIDAMKGARPLDVRVVR